MLVRVRWGALEKAFIFRDEDEFLLFLLRFHSSTIIRYSVVGFQWTKIHQLIFAMLNPTFSFSVVANRRLFGVHHHHFAVVSINSSSVHLASLSLSRCYCQQWIDRWWSCWWWTDRKPCNQAASARLRWNPLRPFLFVPVRRDQENQDGRENDVRRRSAEQLRWHSNRLFKSAERRWTIKLMSFQTSIGEKVRQSCPKRSEQRRTTERVREKDNKMDDNTWCTRT